MDSCMEIKLDNNNKADIQISSLVEELDFHLDHGGHNQTSFPDLQPLPNSQNLRVFLIPHSHCDPGWLETYTKYYENKVRYILSWLHIFAMEHSDFKFIYAEVSFFKLWWEEQDMDVRLDMRRLAQEGRFEFVQGGWVQNDEANTHYFAIFNQMLDGHDWLKKNIPEAMPKSGWAIDPFGLSPTMGYVNKLFGLTGMHIQRVHYAVKNHLAQTKNLDFRWRQSWDSEGTTDMLTHLGPFVSYGQQHSCGPDPDVSNNYCFRLYNAYKTCTDLTILAIQYLLKERTTFSPTSSRLAFNTVEKYDVLGGPSELVLANTLSRDALSLIIVAVNNSQQLQVTGLEGAVLPQQSEPRVEYGEVHYNSKYLVFLADTPSVSIQTYKIVPASSPITRASLDVYNYELAPEFHDSYHSRIHSEAHCKDIVLGTNKLSIVLDCRTGRLLQHLKEGVVTRMEQEILLYNNTAGAYLFLPNGPPAQQVVETSRPRIVVMKGPVRHKAVVKYDRNIVISYIVNLLGDYE
ncbi:uncharacterized protein LOC134810974 [Bolinopsis microptera]|uniref:uncharacterized protein LOC134810974 n=1 Tax=Bolinopsis microptera TaxID=2820187 RepID=UPI00307A345A